MVVWLLYLHLYEENSRQFCEYTSTSFNMFTVRLNDIQGCQPCIQREEKLKELANKPSALCQIYSVV